MLELDQILALPRQELLCCGIYFLINNNEIVYIGESATIATRIVDHATGRHCQTCKKEFTHWTWIEYLDKQERKKAELAYIGQFKPLYNIRGNEIPLDPEKLINSIS